MLNGYTQNMSAGSNEKEYIGLLQFLFHSPAGLGRRSGLIVGALDSGASPQGSSPGRGHCVGFLGKTLYSHSASLHPSV